MMGIPGSEGTQVALLSTNGVFALAQRYTPPLYCTIRTLTGGDGSNIGICSGLDDIVQRNLFSQEYPVQTPTAF